MRHDRSQTKVIATIGPASCSEEILEQMIHEGIDVCRLNFSHGSHDDHLEVIKTVRKINKKLNCNVALLADLQGPKIRIGEVENNGVELVDGAEIIFKTNEKFVGTKDQVYLSYQEFPKDVNIDDVILIDDGKIKLEVIATNKIDTVRAKIIHGGILSSKKGVNLPSTKISLPSLTEKDLEDVHFALDHDVDWVALSFVRSVTDIVQLDEIIKKRKKSASIIAKIEKPEALSEIDNIIDMTKGIMIARGDLGVEVPFDRVPMLQKEIVKKCIEASKPVIIATQMMESMITNFRPTRAEANDVATAVLEGADALMLSGETSVGKFPVEVIRSMQQIIDWTEFHGFEFNREHMPIQFSRTFLPDSICYNACKMAAQTKAKAIVTFSHSGYTAYRIASLRPNADIILFTKNKTLLSRMSLVWGVKAFYLEDLDEIDTAINKSMEFMKKRNLINEDDVVVHVGSTPLNKRGKTNMLKLSYVK